MKEPMEWHERAREEKLNPLNTSRGHVRAKVKENKVYKQNAKR